jgi:hypothetical protein
LTTKPLQPDVGCKKSWHARKSSTALTGIVPNGESFDLIDERLRIPRKFYKIRHLDDREGLSAYRPSQNEKINEKFLAEIQGFTVGIKIALSTVSAAISPESTSALSPSKAGLLKP